MIFNLDVEDRNFYYLTGIEEPCQGIALWDGDVRVLTSNLEASVAEKYVKDVIVFRNSSSLWDLLEKELRKSGVIGLNFSRLPTALFRRMKRAFRGKKIEDVSKRLALMRSVKRKDEMNRLKMAGKIASRVMEKVPDFLTEEMTERELAAELEREARRMGAQGFSFPTIVAGGENSRKIHVSASNSPVKFPLIVDFGPVYRMYTADMSRTFVGKDQAGAYEEVLRVQEKLVELAVQGAGVQELEQAASGLKTPHALGHGVGLDVHEEPFFRRGTELKRGQVVTVEPAIYDPFGIRIEDMVAVKEGVLTDARKDLEFAII